MRAAQAVKDKPSMIKVKTTIGFGSSKAGKEEAHGAPLGGESLKAVKRAFGFDADASFVVPDDVAEVFKAAGRRGAEAESAWNATFARFEAEQPARASEWKRRFAGELPSGWMDKLPRYTAADKADATRYVLHPHPPPRAAVPHTPTHTHTHAHTHALCVLVRARRAATCRAW